MYLHKSLLSGSRPHQVCTRLVFGLFKWHYCRTKVGSLRCITQVVNDSAECNFAQLVCTEDGRTIISTYDWTDFFAPRVKKLLGIKKNHNFRCDSSKPGVVYVKEHADTSELEIDLMKSNPHWSPFPKELPSVVPPSGLTAERQWWYLYDGICPFCLDGDKDTTCPLPDVPKAGSGPGTPARFTSHFLKMTSTPFKTKVPVWNLQARRA